MPSSISANWGVAVKGSSTSVYGLSPSRKPGRSSGRSISQCSSSSSAPASRRTSMPASSACGLQRADRGVHRCSPRVRIAGRDVGSGHHRSDARVGGAPQHGQRGLGRRGPVVDGGQGMAVKVDHAAQLRACGGSAAPLDAAEPRSSGAGLLIPSGSPRTRNRDQSKDLHSRSNRHRVGWPHRIRVRPPSRAVRLRRGRHRERPPRPVLRTLGIDRARPRSDCSRSTPAQFRSLPARHP